MNNDIILLDAIRYCRYSPKSEDEFERMIVENAGQIFGDESIYLDIKKKIANALGEGTIPDGFLFYPEQKRFVMVEVELSSHPVYEHISKQVSKFISAFANYRARQKLASMLKEHIEEEPMLAKRVNPLLGTKGLYEFLEFEVFEPLADAKAFEVVVIIEDKTDSVCEALNWLNPRPKLIEAAVYAREGAEMVKALRFEPQFTFVPQATETSPVPLKEIKKPESLPSNGNTQFPIPVYATYKGKRYEAKLFADGSMEVDGEKFPAPSSAGSAVRGGKPVNGWDFWRLSPVRGADSIQTVRGSIDGQAKIERKELPIGYENDKALPEKAYRLPLLKAIIENGGKITPKEADERVFEIMKKNLSEADHENLDSGPVRWKRWIKWARFHLAKEGLLVHPGKRGIWEVTDKGRDYFEKHKGEI